MPGKVNPVIPEVVCMVSAQVIGNDAAIVFGGAAGNFELNVMLPMLARNLLESIRLLASVSLLFADRCIAGISANADRARQYAEGSPSIVTPLNRYIGYEEVAKVAKQAVAEGKTIREVVPERGYVDDGKLTLEALDVLRMTEPLDVTSAARQDALPVSALRRSAVTVASHGATRLRRTRCHYFSPVYVNGQLRARRFFGCAASVRLQARSTGRMSRIGREWQARTIAATDRFDGAPRPREPWRRAARVHLSQPDRRRLGRGKSGATFTSVNPANHDEVIGEFAASGPADVDAAVEAARPLPGLVMMPAPSAARSCSRPRACWSSTRRSSRA